jgi:general secretion pathway protein E
MTFVHPFHNAENSSGGTAPVTAAEGFGDYLRQRGLDLSVIAKAATPRDGGREPGILERAWRGGLASANDLALFASAYFNLPRIDPEALGDARFPLDHLSIEFLRQGFLLPFDDGTGVRLAAADPSGVETIQAVALALGRALPLCVISFEEIESLFENIGRQGSGSRRPLDADDFDPGAAETDSIEALQDLARGAPVVRAIDQVLERAIDCGATDIHFETGRENLRIRLRVDGLLRLDQNLPRHLAPAVISRVKILAGLDIAERRLPQDGRANVMVRSTEADLRVAVMPAMYGETAVVRILLKDAKLLDLTRIGMTLQNRAAMEGLLREPHGVLIVTGPTGSGKTTTLATAISMLNEPTRKIVTVEDPIEYQIPGIHQTQIKPSIGLTFAAALRSFLRHDPDVIMVGEMRDGETARIGVQAALTGHLVLTTLHTNSAADAVVRLADMGVEPFLIAASLRGVLGQRLVRRLCERCRASDPAQVEIVQRFCQKHELVAPRDQSFFKPVGCPSCGQTGFRGRIGIFEVLRVDAAMRTLIGAKADTARLFAAAREGGSTSMVEDGFAKAGQGLTSVDEVLRTIG